MGAEDEATSTNSMTRTTRIGEARVGEWPLLLHGYKDSSLDYFLMEPSILFDATQNVGGSKKHSLSHQRFVCQDDLVCFLVGFSERFR